MISVKTHLYVLCFALFFCAKANDAQIKEENMQYLKFKSEENIAGFNLQIAYFPRQDVKSGEITFFLTINNKTPSSVWVCNIFDSSIISCVSQDDSKLSLPSNQRLKANVKGGKLPNRPYEVSLSYVKQNDERAASVASDMPLIEIPPNAEAKWKISMSKLEERGEGNTRKLVQLKRGEYQIKFYLNLRIKSDEHAKEFRNIHFNVASFLVTLLDL